MHRACTRARSRLKLRHTDDGSQHVFEPDPVARLQLVAYPFRPDARRLDWALPGVGGGEKEIPRDLPVDADRLHLAEDGIAGAFQHSWIIAGAGRWAFIRLTKRPKGTIIRDPADRGFSPSRPEPSAQRPAPTLQTATPASTTRPAAPRAPPPADCARSRRADGRGGARLLSSRANRGHARRSHRRSASHAARSRSVCMW